MSNSKKKKPKPEASQQEWKPDNEQIDRIECEEKPKKNRFTGESNK